MLHDLNSLLREEKNYESQTADLRVEQKYIDYCLEEKEEEVEKRQGGIVGFSENGRRLGSDICNIRATALWARNTNKQTNKQTRINKEINTTNEFIRYQHHPYHYTLETGDVCRHRNRTRHA